MRYDREWDTGAEITSRRRGGSFGNVGQKVNGGSIPPIATAGCKKLVSCESHKLVPLCLGGSSPPPATIAPELDITPVKTSGHAKVYVPLGDWLSGDKAAHLCVGTGLGHQGLI